MSSGSMTSDIPTAKFENVEVVSLSHLPVLKIYRVIAGEEGVPSFLSTTRQLWQHYHLICLHIFAFAPMVGAISSNPLQ